MKKHLVNIWYSLQGVKTTLTKEQLAEIAKQTKKKLTVEDITNITTAEEVLSDCKTHKKLIDKDFPNTKYWNQYQLETIIKAVNFIDNNYQEWIPNFLDNNYKYYNWFERKSSGWLLGVVSYRYSGSYCSVAFCFLKEPTAKLIGTNQLALYNKYLNNQ